jgi:hypothetical protein
MSNPGFYHNPDPNVSDFSGKVEGSVTQVTGRIEMAARRSKWRSVTALLIIIGMATPVIGMAERHSDGDPGLGAAPATFGKTIPFDLYTHCGIGEIKAIGKYFARVGGTLGDGFGNPPKGWDNPYDKGTLSVVGTSAVFRDTHGHEVNFTLLPKATGFSTMCS